MICIFHLSFLTSLEKKYHQKTCWDEFYPQNENYKAGFSHSWCELDFLIWPMMQLLPINRPTLDRQRGDFRLNPNLTPYEVRISRGNSSSLPGAPRGRCTDPLSSSSHNADTGWLMSVPFIAPVGQVWVRFGLIRFYPKTDIASVLFFHPKVILSLLSPFVVYLFCSLLSWNSLEQERHPKSQVLMILVSLIAVEQRHVTFMVF